MPNCIAASRFFRTATDCAAAHFRPRNAHRDQPSPQRSPAARPAPVPRAPLADVKVPILRAWPGADASFVDYVADSGVDGIVIEALGSGNVSDPMGAAIARACERGIPVVIATSVPHGGVEFAYGGAGGGATLGTVGALPAGPLSAGQARISLATALASGTDPRRVL